MSVVLVIEPDRSQAEVVRQVLHGRIAADLALVQSTKAAIDAIDHRLPDLILLSALLSPRDEKRLIAHLRTLDSASHLQTLTIPQFGDPGDLDEGGGIGRFRKKKKKKSNSVPAGCDPVVFAREIGAHLSRAAEVRSRPSPSLMSRVADPEPPAPEVESAPDAVFTEVLVPAEPEIFEPALAVEPVIEMAEPIYAPEPVFAADSVFAFDPAPETADLAESVFAAASVLAADMPEAPEVIDTPEPLAEPTRVFEPTPMPAPVAAFTSSSDIPSEIAALAAFDLADLVAGTDLAAPPRPVFAEAPVFAETPVFDDVEEIEVSVFDVTPDTSMFTVIEDLETDALASFEMREEPQAQLASVVPVFDDEPADEVDEAGEEEVEIPISLIVSSAVATEPVADEADESAHEALDDEIERIARQLGLDVAALSIEDVNAAPIEISLDAAENDGTSQAVAAEVAVVQAEAEARLAAELERVSAEADERRMGELARLKAEADQARETAIAEARAIAEREARESMADELARVRTETEGAFAADLARVRGELEQTLSSQLDAARSEAERLRAAEISRVAAQAEALRASAAAEARASAEREAREALAAELGRVRTEAEGAFAANLARVRTELEETLSHQLESAKAEAERFRAAESARAEAEAEAALRQKAVADARLSSEAAKARALEAELARVKDEAEQRLQSELERARRDVASARLADETHARKASDSIRESAAREARVIAEAAAQRTLEMEVERVRVQADAVLEMELAKARTESQNRRATELAEIRTQMAEMRATATREARAAAAEAVATEVKRVAASSKPASSPPDYYNLWQPKPAVVVTPPPMPPPIPASPSFQAAVVPALLMPWVKWGVPSAAVVMLAVYTGIPITAVTRLVTKSAKPAVEAVAPVAEAAAPAPVVDKSRGDLKVESTPAGAKILIDGKEYGVTPRTIPDLKQGAHLLVLQSKAGSVSRKVTIRAGRTTTASEGIFAGWLAIFSSIPLEIRLNGKAASLNDEGRIMAAPGVYDVTVSNERFKFHATQKLEVRPGEVTAHTIAMPSGTLHVAAHDGAEIRVDGEVVGHAPLADLPIAIGTHEVTATHPEAGTRRATVDLRAGEATDATLN